MKKTWFFSTIAGIALLASACANNAAPDNVRSYGTNQMPKMGTSIYRDNGINLPGNMQNGMANIGYVTVNRNTMQTANAFSDIFIDRDALARVVGNVTASCPGVQQSTVLVTDEECFIGLTTNGNDANLAKQQARMNATSVCPGYYKVYVTDNPDIISEMNRIASRTNNFATMGVNRSDSDRNIDNLIRRMGGVPDGAEMRTKGAKQQTKR